MSTHTTAEAGASAKPISARIDSIDVLRGLALFGILDINVNTEFRVSLFEQFLPPPASAPPLARAVAVFLKKAKTPADAGDLFAGMDEGSKRRAICKVSPKFQSSWIDSKRFA